MFLSFMSLSVSQADRQYGQGTPLLPVALPVFLVAAHISKHWRCCDGYCQQISISGVLLSVSGGTYDVLATCGLAPNQWLLAISTLHLLETNGTVTVYRFAVFVLVWAGARFVGGRGRIRENVAEFGVEESELEDEGVGCPEDRLQGPDYVFTLVPGARMGAAAGGLFLNMDTVDIAGGSSQLEQLFGAVGCAAASSREQEESLGSGALVDCVER